MAMTPDERKRRCSEASKGPHDRLWKRHPTGICGIPGCGRKHYMKDLCQMHHKRWTRTGSTGPLSPYKVRSNRYTPRASSPAVARSRELPTEQGRVAAVAKARTIVHGERARRIRMLAAIVDRCGSFWETTFDNEGKRFAIATDGSLVEFDDGRASTLSASGWIHDGGRGACRLTRAGEETLSQWRLESGLPSTEPVDEGSDRPQGVEEV